MSTRSGFSREALAIASATVVATPKTLMSEYSVSSDESPSNIRRWSSTRRTLIFPGISALPLGLAVHRRRSLGFERQPELDHCAAIGRGSDQPPSARDLGALAHRDQAEVTWLGIGDLHVEALAVVLDTDSTACSDGAELDADRRCGGVLLDVHERLLRDAIQGGPDAACGLAAQVVLEREGELSLLLEPLQHLAQSRGEAGAIQRGGAEVGHQPAQAGYRLSNRVLELGEQLDLARVGEVPPQLLHAKAGRGHGLDRVVVDVGGDAQPLFFLGRDQPREQALPLDHLEALVELLLSLVALGHVADRSDHQGARFRLHRSEADVDGKLGPVLAPAVELEVRTHRPGQGLRQVADAMADVCGSKAFGQEKVDRLVAKLGARVPEEPLRLGVDDLDDAAGIDDDH